MPSKVTVESRNNGSVLIDVTGSSVCGTLSRGAAQELALALCDKLDIAVARITVPAPIIDITNTFKECGCNAEEPAIEFREAFRAKMEEDAEREGITPEPSYPKVPRVDRAIEQNALAHLIEREVTAIENEESEAIEREEANKRIESLKAKITTPIKPVRYEEPWL